MCDIILERLPFVRYGDRVTVIEGDRMKTKNAGFTLIELLVVVTVIALLAMLLMPSFQGVNTRARTVQCANHLRRVGEAVAGRLASANEVAKLENFTWPGLLVDYLGPDGSMILECPEADGIPTAVSGGISGGGRDKEEIFACIAYHPEHTRRIEFVESGIMAKASQSQYEKYGENMKSVWASGEGYQDDGSGAIYWGYEDQGEGGDDYQDVFIKETITPDGRSKLVCQSETSGKPCVWDTKNDKALCHYDQINYHYGTPAKAWKTETVYVETGSGVGSSAAGSNYAMNAHTIGKDITGKILAMDYTWVVARSTDDWTDAEIYDSNNDGVLDFARHNRRLNVLFLGGDVRPMSPEEIDPATDLNETGYWLP